MKKLFFLSAIIFGLSGCVKEKFDSPPAGGEDPIGVVANTTIKQLRSLYPIGSATPIKIDQDWVISGIVNADDKDGNLYKVVTIQDSTAGIQIKIDNSSLYTEYPVGRRVFVKCKDLYLGEYSGHVQMGGYIDNSDGRADLGYVSSTIAKVKVLGGKWGFTVEPKEVTIASLDNVTYQSMLIKIKDVEFGCSDIYQPWADAINKGSLNRIAQDCSSNQITVRTSGYSRFAAATAPAGKCDITAIFTVFKSGSNFTKQLVLRNQNDAQQTSNTRCDGSTISGNQFISIASLRALFTGATIPAPCASKIRGVVVSDNSQNNFDTRNLVIQDAGAGITCRMSAAHGFAVGDLVEVSTAGAELSEFRGLLQLNNLPLTNVTKVGTETPVPVTVTNSQLNSDFNTYESRLVRVSGVTLSGNNGVYGGNVTMIDATGSFTLYTRIGTNPAAFSTSNYPSGTVTVTAVTSEFNTPQMSIRTTGDIQ
jgi:hypothetical protein